MASWFMAAAALPQPQSPAVASENVQDSIATVADGAPYTTFSFA